MREPATMQPFFISTNLVSGLRGMDKYFSAQCSRLYSCAKILRSRGLARKMGMKIAEINHPRCVYNTYTTKLALNLLHTLNNNKYINKICDDDASRI